METRPERSRDRTSLQDVRGIKEAADLGAEHPAPSRPREQPSHPPKGGDPSNKTKAPTATGDPQCACAKGRACALRSAPRPKSWEEGRPWTGSAERREQGGGEGPNLGALARAHWWPEENTPTEASRPAPPLGRLALPRLAPAPPAGRRSAPSPLVRALAISATHQLRHQQQRRRRRRPPSAAATAATFSSASLYCPRPLDYQVSARLRNLPPGPPGCTCIPPPLSSEMGFMRWALVGGNGGGRSLRPLRSSAGIGVTWKRDLCKGCTRVCVYVLCVCVCGGCLQDPLHADPAEVVPTGWGADGGDLGEGAAMHARTPSFAAMGV